MCVSTVCFRDDMGTLIEHNGKPLYSFFNADQIFDFLLSIGMKPFVELSFMPDSAGLRATRRSFITVPTSRRRRITSGGRSWCKSLVGTGSNATASAEVRQWFFEVWNEPNLPAFWTGTQADYFKLYAETAAGDQECGRRSSKSAARRQRRTRGSTSSSPSAQRTKCRRISSARIITRPMRSASRATTPRRNLRTSRRGILREQARTTSRQAGGKPRLLHRVEHLLEPARSAARRALRGGVRRQDGAGSKWAGARATATGRSRTSSRRTISRRCRFTAASACSTSTASPSRLIARMNYSTNSALSNYWWMESMRR